MLRAAAASTLVGCGAGTYYISEQVGGWDNLARSMSYNTLAVPGFIAYKYTDWRTKPERGVSLEDRNAAFLELDRKYSKLALEKVNELKGFYIKNGQMIANNVGDAAPPLWQETMKPLLDHCPTVGFDLIRSVVEEDLGEPLEARFATFNERPFASASIGQVHRATLKGSGERVVVKVQYPDVERTFRGDVRTIKYFCTVAMPEHVPVFDEIEKQFMTEFDYRKEAQNLDLVRNNLDKSGKFPDFVVPQPHRDLCTKRVLTMQELHPAQSLVDALQEDIKVWAELSNQTPKQLIDEQRRLDEEAWGKGEERDGMTGEAIEDAIRVVGWTNFAKKWLGVLFVPAANLLGYGRFTVNGTAQHRLPINQARMVDRLLEVHGHEIFVDGAFNGDPHPGNFMLVQPGSKIGLIDYGQVKLLTLEQRLVLARLIKALCDNDDERIHKSMLEMGFQTKHNKREVATKLARLYFDRNNKASTDGLHVQLYVEKLQQQDPIVSQADDYLMAGRVAIMLRGFGDHLHQHRSTAQAWLPFAEALLREHGELPTISRRETNKRAQLARRNSRL